MSKQRKSNPPGAECPICRHKFATGTTGWYSHIGALRNHPNWHPEERDPNARKELFMAEFPAFFADALTPGRRTPAQIQAVGVRNGPTLSAPSGIAKFCSQCGVRLPPDPPPRFCPQCGARVAPMPVELPNVNSFRPPATE